MLLFVSRIPSKQGMLLGDLGLKLNWPVGSTGKVSDGCIRDMKFNFHLHQNWLVSGSDNKELLLGMDAIGWNSLSKKKKRNVIVLKLSQKKKEKGMLSFF